MLTADVAPIGKDHGAFDRVAQFPDVAGPAVRQQLILGVLGDARGRAAEQLSGEEVARTRIEPAAGPGGRPQAALAVQRQAVQVVAGQAVGVGVVEADVEVVEAFEKEHGLKPLSDDPRDFARDMAALFIALQPSRAEKKRGAVD
mgnify:CR=1 FL=1